MLTFAADGAGLWVQWGSAPRVFSQLDWQGETAHLFTPQGATRITCAGPAGARGRSRRKKGGRLTAPDARQGGVVCSVKAGDTVSKPARPLAVMEAMKMEHTIAAPADGKVGELMYVPGDQVAEGAELLKMES